MLPDLISKLRDRRALKNAYRRVFETPDGRLVLRHLMLVGFVMKSTFVVRDPHESSLNEGSRRIVLSILRMALRDDSDIDQAIEEIQQQE